MKQNKNHDHYFSQKGFLICPLCGEKFDIPVQAIKKSDTLKGGSITSSERTNVLPERTKRTTRKNSNIH